MPKMSNRCPRCGGITKHILIEDYTGTNYYKCFNQLSSLQDVREDNKTSIRAGMRECGTVINDKGIEYNGDIVYRDDNGKQKVFSTEDKNG